MSAYEDDAPLLDVLSRYWWMTAFRGLIIAVYGTLIFVWPYKSTLGVVVMISAYMLLTGFLALALAVRARKGWARIGAFIMPGILSVLIGLLAFFSPEITVVLFIGIVGFFWVILGLIEVLMALHLRKVLLHKWALLLAGVVSGFAGVSILRQPVDILLFDLSEVGVGSLVVGALLMVLAIQMRHIKDVSPSSNLGR